MARYIKDKKIVELVNTSECINLIKEFLESYGRTVKVDRRDNTILIQVEIESFHGWSNIVMINQFTDPQYPVICINPFQGDKLGEVYDYIMGLPQVIRDRRLNTLGLS